MLISTKPVISLEAALFGVMVRKAVSLSAAILTVLQLPPDVAAMIKYHTLASHTYISKGRSCSFYINNIEIQCM